MGFFSRMMKFVGIVQQFQASHEKYLPAIEQFLPGFLADLETDNMPGALAALEKLHTEIKSLSAAATAAPPAAAGA